MRNLAIFIHSGSGKIPFRIPDPGVEKALDPESGSATLLAKMKEGYRKTGSLSICDGQILPKIVKHWYLPTPFFLINDYL
jgi:hypothetical protein